MRSTTVTLQTNTPNTLSNIICTIVIYVYIYAQFDFYNTPIHMELLSWFLSFTPPVPNVFVLYIPPLTAAAWCIHVSPCFGMATFNNHVIIAGVN